MKKFLLLIFAFLFSFPIFADLNGNGYYRVQNAYTKRYIYVLDNYGSYSFSSTSADVGAIELFMDVTRKNSDPATVMFVRNQSESYYDIAAQGTSIYSILSAYVKLREANSYEGAMAYNIYASKSSLVKYLSDRWKDLSDDEGLISVDKADAVLRYWYFNPIDAATDEFFGIAPSITAGGKYYHPFFAGFPFKANSEGMKFYVVKEVDPIGVAVISEVNEAVPAGTPVIVECSNPLASGNRLDIRDFSDYGNAAGNQLTGIYFDNNNSDPVHYNRTPFDRNSMRVLGVVDGKLAFVRANYDFVPRNQAFLNLSNPSLQNIDNILIMTASELDDFKNSVEVIPQDVDVDVYSVDGRLVKASLPKTEVSSLPKGLYILRAGNQTEKLLLK